MNISAAHPSDTAANNMTSMIDVVFLLIIFFMVAAQFSNQMITAGINLPAAQAANEDQGAGRLIINITDKGEYICSGIRHSLEALTTRITAYAMQSKPRSNTPQPTIMIRADKYIPYGRIQDMMSMISRNDICSIDFAVKKN